MFGFIEDLGKAVLGTMLLPVSLVSDVVTLGGSLTDKGKPYTATAAENIMENLENAVKPS